MKKSGTTFDFVLFSIAWTNLAIMTKARCIRHTFYTLADIHEHIFDKKIIWLSGWFVS